VADDSDRLLAGAEVERRHPPDVEAPVRRLLVLRAGAIGDTLVALPALLALRRRFPGAEITVAGNATALPLAASSGLIDRWLGFDDARVTRLFMAGEPPADDPFRGIDIAVAWGRDADGTLRSGLARRGARTVVVAPSRPDATAPVHVARHLLRTLAPLGIEPDDPARWLPALRIPPETQAEAEAELAAAGLDQRTFVAVHPGSGSPLKNWPAEQFARVRDGLLRSHGLATVVLAGPADAAALAILHDSPSGGGAELVDRPLLLLAAVLRRAAAFLGNDSGLAHLAGMLGLPTLTLFGPSDPTLWTPLGPRVQVLRSASLASLPAEMVLDALASMLQSGG
jgi:ADP-heptose:LPS heptosyltransferase